MDTGAAGHFMAVELIPHVKIERTCEPKKFVAACGEQIKDLGERNILFKSNERNTEVATECCDEDTGIEEPWAHERTARWVKYLGDQRDFSVTRDTEPATIIFRNRVAESLTTENAV